MSPSPFFALISRTKYINRWGLMRGTETENLQEHSYETAILAHALATIDRNERGVEVNPDRAAVMALYHDVSEILTGDMPTPVKYYNEEIRTSYRRIERRAVEALAEKLPDYLRDDYWQLMNAERAPEWKYVKAADTLSGYLKCLKERKAGSEEFAGAEASLRERLVETDVPALDDFLRDFLPAYTQTLDEQTKDLL